MGCGHWSYHRRNKSSYNEFIVLLHKLYRLQHLRSFVSRKGRCSTSAARPHLLVWLAIERCFSAWQAVYICPILALWLFINLYVGLPSRQVTYSILRSLTDHQDTSPDWCHFTHSVGPGRSTSFFLMKFSLKKLCFAPRYFKYYRSFFISIDTRPVTSIDNWAQHISHISVIL